MKTFLIGVLWIAASVLAAYLIGRAIDMFNPSNEEPRK